MPVADAGRRGSSSSYPPPTLLPSYPATLLPGLGIRTELNGVRFSLFGLFSEIVCFSFWPGISLNAKGCPRPKGQNGCSNCQFFSPTDEFFFQWTFFFSNRQKRFLTEKNIFFQPTDFFFFPTNKFYFSNQESFFPNRQNIFFSTDILSPTDKKEGCRPTNSFCQGTFFSYQQVLFPTDIFFPHRQKKLANQQKHFQPTFFSNRQKVFPTEKTFFNNRYFFSNRQFVPPAETNLPTDNFFPQPAKRNSNRLFIFPADKNKLPTEFFFPTDKENQLTFFPPLGPRGFFGNVFQGMSGHSLEWQEAKFL